MIKSTELSVCFDNRVWDPFRRNDYQTDSMVKKLETDLQKKS